MNRQAHAVLSDVGTQAIDFVRAQAFRPEMVAAELNPLKPVADREIEHFTGIGLRSKTNRRDSEVGHRLTPFSGLLSPHARDCQPQTRGHDPRNVMGEEQHCRRGPRS
jgi:hypothetical protein